MEDFITKASITQDGEIAVNRIDLIVDTNDVKVWHINLVAKYAQLLSFSNQSLCLMASPETLNIVEGKQGTSTVITFQLPDDGPDFRWSVICDCARYTARFVAYRISWGYDAPEPVDLTGTATAELDQLLDAS